MAGSSSSRGSGGKKKARIEIIPLIDVIFFLLATFVLFTLSLNKSAGTARRRCPSPRRASRATRRDGHHHGHPGGDHGLGQGSRDAR